ncbi:MAG: hypothetical protein PT944_01460 [Actinomycetaceae bacterium]|nr:hypothetical protein [Arcanobacterium sp.]MDD7686572.1 hypothetical protein [Actinomycetaceae bacterium]MDY5272852.1 glycine zipper domain-containing protein [Arcanobacterium sp.]
MRWCVGAFASALVGVFVGASVGAFTGALVGMVVGSFIGAFTAYQQHGNRHVAVMWRCSFTA